MPHRAKNTNDILWPAAVAAQVNQDCTHITGWTAATSGTLLWSRPITTNPNPLQLGDRLTIRAGALQLTQAVGTGGTEEDAKRAVTGRVKDGLYVQAHIGDPGSAGTANLLPGLARLQIAENEFTIETYTP